MNDLCVILGATAIVGSGLGAIGADAREFRSERVMFAGPIRIMDSAGSGSAAPQLAFPAEINDGKAVDRPTGPVIIDSQYVRRPFMWPWASSPSQDRSNPETQRSYGNRNGGSGGGRSGGSGGSGSSNSGGGSQSGGGNMGGGNSSGGGNMGGGSSGGSEGGGMN
jgi:hypothetical protein